MTPYGEAVVTKIDIFAQAVTVEDENKNEMRLTLDQIQEDGSGRAALEDRRQARRQGRRAGRKDDEPGGTDPPRASGRRRERRSVRRRRRGRQGRAAKGTTSEKSEPARDDRRGQRSKFYITTAIDYVNDLPHLGTAYEKICADIIARYMRLRGPRHLLLDGQRRALPERARRRRPRRACRRTSTATRWRRPSRTPGAGVAVSYDGFIRTSEPRHERAVQEIFRRINAKGDIYKAKYAGWYCVSCEGFLQEEDLVDGKCPTHKMAAHLDRRREHVLRALQVRRSRLLAHIEANPELHPARDPAQRDREFHHAGA